MRYPYRCSKCKNEFIISKSIADASKQEKCSKCGSVAERIYSGPAIKTNDGFKS